MEPSMSPREIARHLIPLSVLLLLTVLWLPQARANADPEVLLERVSQQMIDALQEQREAVKARPARLFELVDQVLSPHVDFPRMSRWVLGKYWRQADAAQRERFMHAFRDLLVRFYTGALLDDPAHLDTLLSHTDGLIQFVPGRHDAKAMDATVRCEVHLPGTKPVPVSFAVHRRDGDWKVYDVNVEGISLVTNYRSSFGQQIRRDGLENLITRLEQRNETLLREASGGTVTNAAAHPAR
jgi:phospholipid transport system substrate-binding protein